MKHLLAIESSCDETGAALFSPTGELIEMEVATQPIHTSYGGVVPELASRAHLLHIVPVVDTLLHRSGKSLEAIDRIAVTQGPGLLGALLVGVQFAKGLASRHRLSLYGVHHIRAHLMANFIEGEVPPFPFLGLVVSGGHTQLIFARSVLDMEVVGSTRDDAVGEAFDKIAKLIGYPYPGGRYIDEAAQLGDRTRFLWPRSRVEGLDFSFSGIKTAVMYRLREEERKDTSFIEKARHDLAASVQHALVEMIAEKVEAALALLGPLPLVVGGGVAANSGLRSRLLSLTATHEVSLFLPRLAFCTDNAAMIGITAHHACQAGAGPTPYEALEALPRFAL